MVEKNGVHRNIVTSQQEADDLLEEISQAIEVIREQVDDGSDWETVTHNINEVMSQLSALRTFTQSTEDQNG